jgi:hypothetical protein
MNPRELSLFTAKEQTLLVATERARLDEMSEDELGDLLGLVRRARNKYTGLHRRQSGTSVAGAGKRYAATTSNQRTLRKAEIFEDALSRVAKALSAAARATRDELKRERLDAARAAKGAPTPAAGASRSGARSTPSTKRSGTKVTSRRAASTTASNARNQARRDTR